MGIEIGDVLRGGNHQHAASALLGERLTRHHQTGKACTCRAQNLAARYFGRMVGSHAELLVVDEGISEKTPPPSRQQLG